jgi:hypothetical protein
MRKLFLILVLALPTGAARAQTFYYQSVMPDGRVVIGDKPAPGAKQVQQVPLRAGNTSTPLAPPPAELSPAARAAGQPQQRPPAATSFDELKDAQQQLQAAKAALDGAAEPLAGERIGTAGGKSRLTDAYFQRIKGLENAVAVAQQRVDELQTGRTSPRTAPR